MARILKPALAFVFCMSMACSVEAFWIDAIFCHIQKTSDQMEHDRQENIKWPKQYVDNDRINAKAPFDVMIENGWRRQNLLGRHHFNEDCTQLTEAGKLRVQWILTQPPAQYRQVFIERDLRQEITATRVATANEFAAVVMSNGGTPNITETHLIASGRPATIVNFVNTSFRDSMPKPVLPASDYAAPGN